MNRPACFLDIPAIINLGYKYVEEEVKPTGHHSSAWDADLSAHHLCQSLTDDNIFLWVATSVGGDVVGFLWAAIHPMAPWCNTPVASDYLFYINPEYRGKYCAIGLIKAYRKWAEDKGCAEARLSLASGIKQERVGCTYELLGFEAFGSVYCKHYKET